MQRKHRPGRWAAVSCAIASLALAASGCGSSASSSSGKVNLTFWDQWGSNGPNGAALNYAIHQYEKLHPNVTITTTYVTNDAKILAAISGHNPPDLIDLGTSVQMGGWGSQGALIPLNSYITSSHLNTNQYVPASLKAVSVGSTIYGLPFMDFNAGLLYNKKLFAEAGLNPNHPPTTTQELYNDAVKLTKVGPGGVIKQLGFLPAYPGAANGQTCTLESLAWDFGGGWYSGTKPTADAAANIAALTWEDSFYKKFGAQQMAAFENSAGAYMTGGDPLTSGKLAMTFDGPWVLAHMNQTDPAMAKNIGLVPFPSPSSNPAATGTSFLDTNPQVIPRGSSNPQAAFDFIKWETTDSALATYFANKAFNLPQLRSAAQPSYSGAGVFVREASSANAHTWPQVNYSSTYQTQLCNAEAQTVAGKSTPAAALQNLQQITAQAASSG